MALTRVETKYGTILGQPSGNQRVSVFKGVPFAKPPVGELRWKAPQKPDPWEGEYKAYTFSPIPMQWRHPKGSWAQKELYPTELPRSEDCLYLNVWTPAESPDEKLPVLFYIFGGGCFQGYGSKIELDGDGYGKRGCIFVTINYRLHIFGFLAHPELSAETDYHGSGNYGYMDQIAALDWVKENIAAFGGDPDNITVYGQSAGAGSTVNMMTSPLSRNKFKRAIIQSSGGFLGKKFARVNTLAEQEAKGKKFLDYVGVSTIEEARLIPAETLQGIYERYARENNFDMQGSPCIDNYVIDKTRDEVFKGER